MYEQFNEWGNKLWVMEKNYIMNICRLCNENEADQTGSHILSCLSIKSMIGERGEEKSYLISPDPTENYRKNTQATEVKEDYILCRACEQRLSYVEGYIAAELTNKIKQKQFAQNFPLKTSESISFLECQRVNPYVFHIFLYSLIWRASISKTRIFVNFSLSPDIEERLRTILNTRIPPRSDYRGVTLSHKNWFRQLEEHKNDFNQFKYILLSTEQIEDNTEGFVIFHPTLKNPYSIMLNEWVIYFHITATSTEDIFNLLDDHNRHDLLNGESQLIKVIQLSNEKWNAVRKGLVQTLKDQKIKNTREHLTTNYLHQFGCVPPAEVINALILDFIENLDKNE